MATFNDWLPSTNIHSTHNMMPQSAFNGGLLGFPTSRCDQCHFTGSPAHAVSCSMCAAPMFGIGDVYEGGDMLSASLAGVSLDSRTFDRAPMPTPNGAGQFGNSYQPQAYASELGSNALLGMTGAWNALGSGGAVVVGGMKTFGSVVAAAATNPVTSTAVGTAPVATTGTATPPPWSGIVGRPYLDNEGGGGETQEDTTTSISAADAAAALALATATSAARRPRCTNNPCIARGTHVTHTFGECRAEGGPIGGCVNPVCIAGNRARSHHWEEW